MPDLWGYDVSAQHSTGAELTGYKVEATDGLIGKVDEASDEVGSAYLVVNCKPWLIGRHVLLPAGTVTRIDSDHMTVHVGRTKEQIKGSPEYDPDTMRGNVGYRDTLGRYYGPPPAM
jgi:hypothetical protein